MEACRTLIYTSLQGIVRKWAMVEREDRFCTHAMKPPHQLAQPPKPCHASVANYIQYRAKKGGEGLSSLRRSLQTSSVTYIAITRRSYLVVGHPESLAILRDIRQLHPQGFVLPDPIAVKAAHPSLQIVLGVVASPRRGYHHHVDRVRWVKLGE